MRAYAAFALAILVAGGAQAQQAEGTVVLLRPGEAGPATDLVAFEALVGGETIAVASDFGFVQASEDGYAILAVRTRTTDGGLTVLPCEGGLAPASLPGVYEGAYACTGEIPVPISYQPASGKLLPNLLDPNGVWEDEGFFVSALMSIKVTPARPVALPPGAVRPVFEGSPEPVAGLIGRVAPPNVQAAGPCGADGVALYFPLAELPACADAELFSIEDSEDDGTETRKLKP